MQSSKDGPAHGAQLHTFHDCSAASARSAESGAAAAASAAATEGASSESDVAKKEHQHESFCRELEGAEDGFAKVAEWFGKGVMA